MAGPLSTETRAARRAQKRQSFARSRANLGDREQSWSDAKPRKSSNERRTPENKVEAISAVGADAASSAARSMIDDRSKTTAETNNVGGGAASPGSASFTRSTSGAHSASVALCQSPLKAFRASSRTRARAASAAVVAAWSSALTNDAFP